MDGPQMYTYMFEWTYGWAKRYRWMDRLPMDGYKDVWMMFGWTDKCMDGCKDVEMGLWMDGWIYAWREKAVYLDGY